MDETMKRTAFFISLALTILSGFSYAKYKFYPDDRPIEFMQSLVLGSKKVTLEIPKRYQMIQHEQINNQHKLGFIFDKESLEHWNQFINLNIITNTTETAAMRISALQSHINREHKDVLLLNSDINRQSNGLQDASISISYTDELGEMVIAAHYYSDSASLIGVEVSQRVKKSIGNAVKLADKVTESIVHLSNT